MNRSVQLSQNAIQLSTEFLDHGKRDSALAVLFEALRVRRGKSWSSSLEDVMTKFVNLCLNMKNTQALRDGANQFKLLCQLTNVGSFEAIMRHFFDLCIEEADKAREQSREKTLTEDLDQIETPETIILKSITETTRQDRAEHHLLVPILKFTWEAFRNILDTCKNNRNFERVYSDVCRKAFSFLVKFERRTEFRKLCDVTRGHLNLIIKYTQHTMSIDLTDSSSMDTQLQIRLGQLDAAMSLELWTEAFRTMEDIHYLLRLTKKPPHPKILAIFYQKISVVFSKAQVPIFHAIALFKLFILIKEHKKGFKPDELIKISSTVLAAALSVPLDSEYNDLTSILVAYAEQSTPALQLSSILGLNAVPTRRTLIEDLIKASIPQYADPSVVKIFNMLNGSMNLKICGEVSQAILEIPESLKEELSIYFDPIQKIAYTRLLVHISQVFSCVYMDQLLMYSKLIHYDRVFSLTFEAHHKNLVKFLYDDSEGLLTFISISETVPFTNLKNHRFICELMRDVHVMNDLFLERENVQNRLLEEFSKNPSVEFFRYKKINDDILKYAERRNQESEEANKLQATKLENDRLKMEQIQTQQLEEDRKKRDQRRQKQESDQKELRSTIGRVSDLKASTLGKKLLKDITADGELNTAAYINAQREIKEKEIILHVKRVKKLEKTLEAFVYGVQSFEEPRILEYISTSKKRRIDNWTSRDNARVETMQKMQKMEKDLIQRLQNAADDIEKFVMVSGERAKELHQKLLDEYNEMFDKERQLVFQQKRAEYIQKRKDEHIEKKRQEIASRRAIAEGSKAQETYKPPTGAYSKFQKPEAPRTPTKLPNMEKPPVSTEAKKLPPTETPSKSAPKPFTVKSRSTSYFGETAPSTQARNSRFGPK
ncbi:Eukaryotic translation initiation factor 3 subunit A [Thelohanellus kitauei]|uniref:Eukaryotic translation initiation factor 3 subunit A n=1 Tax=Thelohanellus kitauei TaxID=669202 RepID=A0A0C2M876_THEKT|nr:Eukaryotic translation initiation factor 3 subunit A [Thelohanellus kitauei]